jgi:hypothetical protein
MMRHSAPRQLNLPPMPPMQSIPPVPLAKPEQPIPKKPSPMPAFVPPRPILGSDPTGSTAPTGQIGPIDITLATVGHV